jgi:protein involved in polysaccharide export with SLBB domain
MLLPPFRTGILAVLLLAAFTWPCGAQSAPPSAAAADVYLEPGDVVRVAIWREDDLSGDFLVDENGLVTFPLLGEQQVTEIPIRQLRETLLSAYRVYLRNPSINVTPLRRINVLGEVNRPGSYEVDPTVSLIGVVAMAAGPTGMGDIKRIRVVRNGQVIHGDVAPESSLGSLGVRSGDQIMVAQRNWLARNTPLVVSVLLTIPSVIYTITMIRRSW